MRLTIDHYSVLLQTSCIWEVSARKVGNVHPASAFSDAPFTAFLVSAAVLARTVGDNASRQEYGIGLSVLMACDYTRYYVGTNTNLGIALLLAPLVATRHHRHIRPALAETLSALTREDAAKVYEAIRLANPGGLGAAPEQDVRDEPTVTLLEAMRLAADRDLIARQYANGFADVFDFGVPAFLAAFAKFGRVEPAVIECQLKWLAEFPDSLITRKNGTAVAEDVRRRAVEVMRFGGLDTPQGRRAGVELDRHLRSDGNRLNPGTTADLVTACLFVALRENKVKPADPFRWDVPDWL
jgi:triphosphoribosyl-dephospho-CoA synthase